MAVSQSFTVRSSLAEANVFPSGAKRTDQTGPWCPVNVARSVGPAIAGILIATVGNGICFLANATSFVAVVFSLTTMDGSQLAPVAPTARVFTLASGISSSPHSFMSWYSSQTSARSMPAQCRIRNAVSPVARRCR